MQYSAQLGCTQHSTLPYASLQRRTVAGQGIAGCHFWCISKLLEGVVRHAYCSLGCKWLIAQLTSKYLRHSSAHAQISCLPRPGDWNFSLHLWGAGRHVRLHVYAGLMECDKPPCIRALQQRLRQVVSVCRFAEICSDEPWLGGGGCRIKCASANGSGMQ